MMSLDHQIAENGIAALLRLLGRDPDTDAGVRDTPARFVRAVLEVGQSTTNPVEILSCTF